MAADQKKILCLEQVGICYKLRKGFLKKGDYWALTDVSFQVNPGETVCITGRNGAGKSSLLRVIAGIISPDKGRVLNRSRQTTLLSLQAGFIPHLTGRQNAILNGLLLGMQRREIEEKMDEIIAFAELEDFIDQNIQSYSTGMTARLGFAVAFMADPDILLLDEVMGVGDASFRAKSTAAMRERLKSDRTVIMVSHNPQAILDICDRVVWIEKGATRLDGPPREVLDIYHKHLGR